MWLVVFSKQSQISAIFSVFVNVHGHQETLELPPTAFVDHSWFSHKQKDLNHPLLKWTPAIVLQGFDFLCIRPAGKWMHLEIPLTNLVGPLKLSLPDVVKATAKMCSFWGEIGPCWATFSVLVEFYLNIISLVKACGCRVFVKAPLSVWCGGWMGDN